MNYSPPKLILVTSDSSIMEYKRTIPKSKKVNEEVFVYKFIKAETKIGLEFSMNEEQILKGLTNSFKEINEKV